MGWFRFGAVGRRDGAVRWQAGAGNGDPAYRGAPKRVRLGGGWGWRPLRPLVVLLGVGWLAAVASACLLGGSPGPTATPVPTPILMTVGSPTVAPVTVVREVTVLATVIQTVVHT